MSGPREREPHRTQSRLSLPLTQENWALFFSAYRARKSMDVLGSAPEDHDFFSGYFLGSANFFVDKYLDFIHFFLIWEGVPGVRNQA